MRYLTCVALLVAAAGCFANFAPGQQSQASEQEGVQQRNYQNMTPAERAAATRTFLGLGAEPDRAAASRGTPLFARNCAFCHGSTARGATAPSLITSDFVLADDHGEHLAPFLKKGLSEKGMPAFARMSDQQLKDIAEFLHLEVEDVANRGTYQVVNILVGDPVKGRAYVEGHCMSCHTADTFAHVATKFRTPDQLQRNWIWPARDENVTAKVTTTEGTIAGRVIQMSDFRITLVDSSGVRHVLDRGPKVEVQLDDSLKPHKQVVMSLANDDMHNVTAYLETQK